ncbi:hypothetical protein Ctha_0990 [Chloroherpeton thalassium ATCC 35110]|uniref:Lipoprotein n=1 Tax=Chloroherpeton thalassium (strain ATCC 35110 / GB-78) TaxID=517418 RepID=B3QXI1_CHLT3|nr:hypothetical protein [Chloroherpeton thalassium]ACF13455.1 hypothetical protein Ctha_0990 [Chloroherpeton thalassium ATCC 35110]
MKKLHYFRLLTLLLCAVLITAACDDDDDDDTATGSSTDQHEDAFGDVFVKKVKSSSGDKYGLVFYAGGEGLTACSATAPDGTEYELAEFWKGEGNMRRHPADTEMASAMPETGDYTFKLTFDDGQTIELTDALENVEIPSITLNSVSYDSETGEVTATWESVSGVGYYMVKLTDEDKNENEPLFNNKRVSADATEYTFSKTTTASPGWLRASDLETGDICYVMVVGVKYEADAELSTYDQNKQMNTVQMKQITW